jgi:hypothetical protein
MRFVAAPECSIVVGSGHDRLMISVSVAPSASARPLERSRAHPGPGAIAEFFLVGGLTPLLFPLAWLLRRSLGLDSAEFAVGFTMFYAAHAINDPHFAVTYVLFYKDARAKLFGSTLVPLQRARYLAAGLVVPLALCAWAIAAIATGSAASLALMIQLMFFLVGWHYVKQGFGVMTVLAARRGVRFSRRERLTILAHCFAGWAYAWASPADAGTEVEEKGVVYTTIAHSIGLERGTHVVFLATALSLACVLALKWRREGRLPLFTPLVALLASIWSWSIYSSIDPLVAYVIPALHSAQYLYVVWLMKKNQAREREGPPWFETSAPVRLGRLVLSALVLGWIFFHAAPTVLDDWLRPPRGARLPLGPTPYFAALFSIVNLHHYFMDAVIWRRDNPLTRYLRDPAEAVSSMGIDSTT